MKTYNMEQGSHEWFEVRKRKISGTRAGKIVTKRGNGKKAEFFKLMAEFVAEDIEEMDPRERGHSLEVKARDWLQNELGKEVKEIGFAVRDDNGMFGLSPDGIIGKTEAAEFKGLQPAGHLEIWYEMEKQKVVMPKAFADQILQYFFVIEDLEKLHFVSYCPEVKSRPVLHYVIKREDIAELLIQHETYLKDIETEMKELIEEFSF